MEIGHTIKSVAMGMPSLVTGGHPMVRAGEERMAWTNPNLAASADLLIQSDAFENFKAIPFIYSAYGEAINPPMNWSAPPAGVQSMALIVEDPDAPTPNPFVHWLVYNMSSHTRRLPENTGKEPIIASADGAMQGKNSTLKIGWTGMAPPKGDSPHHYHFQLFALDSELALEPGAGRHALLEAMAGRVIARGRLIGTYQR